MSSPPSPPPLPLSSPISSFPLFLWRAFTSTFIPYSLSNYDNPGTEKILNPLDAQSPALSQLRAGDLILVKTPGAFYRFFRGLAGHEFDHLAIVMSAREFLHVGPPLIRKLPLELLINPKRRPIVYRPALAQSELNDLLNELNSLVGRPYDTLKVYSFIGRLAAAKFVENLKGRGKSGDSSGKPGEPGNSQQQQQQTPQQSPALICTDAILSPFSRVSPRFQSLFSSLSSPRSGSDFGRFRAWSINDIQRLARHSEELLKKIEIPGLGGQARGAKAAKARGNFFREFLERWLIQRGARVMALVSLWRLASVFWHVRRQLQMALAIAALASLAGKIRPAAFFTSRL